MFKMTVQNEPDKQKIVHETDAETEQYGITRAHVDVYSYSEYRYTNLKDAVAQAKRDEARRRVTCRTVPF